MKHVVVTDLRDNTFYARICYVSTHEGLEKEVDIDARPSDAINLAVRFQVRYDGMSLLEQRVSTQRSQRFLTGLILRTIAQISAK